MIYVSILVIIGNNVRGRQINIVTIAACQFKSDSPIRITPTWMAINSRLYDNEYIINGTKVINKIQII